MIEREVEIINETGLHTRPGNQFVKLAKTFPCDIIVRRGETEFSAKSLLKLMKVGVSKGDHITIVCDGEKENEAIDALSNFLANLTE
ncbi:MAG: HPr family phosphocarrier protein [Sphaerochaetaceae bacterium]|nr:HPr family phosphocarrier protein [Sphaerochaetaceae bacterium]MDC7238528.1 HPr family phosphocarrier protein [Sphaerochaetaceae bacterium]MDC7242444.1 HPr family phosphocarrier protein [Sphaerochaetaceae bacterium]MDC7248826.1 HPr family phosphocarrier protein [Sphaerochaetaceae bacterium]